MYINCIQHREREEHEVNQGPAAAAGSLTKPWVTYPKIWLGDIDVVPIEELCLKVLGQMPRPVDGHLHSVHYFPMNATEAGWEVSALSQNNIKVEIMRSRCGFQRRDVRENYSSIF